MEPGPPRRATRGRRRPIFSEPSVLPKEKAPDSSCPPATARPWPCISRKSRLRSRQEHMRAFFSIRQDGMFAGSCRCPATLPSRVEPSRKYLVVHPRQLALEQGFQILRRHPRSLLLRLEQAYDGIYRISFAPCAMWGGRGRRTFVGGDVTALGMVALGLAFCHAPNPDFLNCLLPGARKPDAVAGIFETAPRRRRARAYSA